MLILDYKNIRKLEYYSCRLLEKYKKLVFFRNKKE